EQSRNLCCLARALPHSGFSQEDRFASESADFSYCGAKNIVESVLALIVVSVDTNPGNIRCPWPPGIGMSNFATKSVDCPQPDHIANISIAESGYYVPPSGYPGSRRRMIKPPAIPVTVHFMSETYNDRMPVGANRLCIRAQVSIILPTGDLC